MQRDEILERICESFATLGFTANKRHCGRIVGKRQVIVGPRKKRPVRSAVIADAANGDASEPDAVVAARTADQSKPAALSGALEIGPRELERGIARFRAGIDEKDVVEASRRELSDRTCKTERFRVRELECRCVVELSRGRGDRISDRLPRVARIHAPKAG